MNKYENILYLNNPKKISNVIDLSEKNNLDVHLPNLMNPSSYSLKSSKKNKLNFKTIDNKENKKNRAKLKRKSRTKIYVNQNISSINDHLELHEGSTVPTLKSVKSIKNKKSHDHKLIIKEDRALSLKNDINTVYLNDLLTVQELSKKLNLASTEIIKWLFLQGISVTINQVLDISISTLVAEHYSFNVLKQEIDQKLFISNKLSQQTGNLRAPVITLLGHVDHGKTSLLKAIQKENFLIQEDGNITQSIGSYEILLENNQSIHKLIFLDTPGHEAFVKMRTRGADITDLAILVVSADDGLKPQTIEAINHIQQRKLNFIVAINKIDKTGADINSVKKQLSEFNIYDKDANGNLRIVGVSALTGENIDLLLSSLMVLCQNQNLRCDPSQRGEGTILEAYLDKQRGPVAKLLVQNGTLYVGDIIVAGNIYGKVKAIYNSHNKKVERLESTSLADILCFAEVPDVGLVFKVVNNEKIARSLAASYTSANSRLTILHSRISLDDINAKRPKNIIQQINLIIKTDTQGSIDAIVNSLLQIPQEKVQINLLLVAPGAISLKDLQLAYTTQSIILAFKLNINSSTIKHAQSMSVSIAKFNVIYNLIDYVKTYMLNFVELDYERKILGLAEVKTLFQISKGVVAGCLIRSGKFVKNTYFQLKRDSVNQYTGFVDSLKRGKIDVDEVDAGNECGIMCKSYNLWQVGDELESYELKPLEKTL